MTTSWPPAGGPHDTSSTARRPIDAGTSSPRSIPSESASTVETAPSRTLAVTSSVVSAMPYAGMNARARKPAGPNRGGERRERVGAHRLGARDDALERGQVEAAELLVGHEARAEGVGEVGTDRVRRAVLRDQLEPEQRPPEELAGRREHAVGGHRHRLQQLADQAHVVVVREPPHRPGRGGDPDRARDGGLVGDEVAVAHHHALRQAGRPRRVLQDRERVRRDRRGGPVIDDPLDRADRHEVRAREGVARLQAERRQCRAVREDEAAARVDDDRLEATQCDLGLPRRRDGDRGGHEPRVERRVERPDEVEPRFERQHRDLTRRVAQRGQRRGIRPGLSVQVRVRGEDGVGRVRVEAEARARLLRRRPRPAWRRGRCCSRSRRIPPLVGRAVGAEAPCPPFGPASLRPAFERGGRGMLRPCYNSGRPTPNSGAASAVAPVTSG